jgi:hypothetical protein
VRYRFIQAHRERWPARLMCDVPDVPPTASPAGAGGRRASASGDARPFSPGFETIRHGRAYAGKTAWNETYRAWIAAWPSQGRPSSTSF